MFQTNINDIESVAIEFTNMSLRDARDMYVIYQIWLGEELVFIGQCKWSQFPAFPDLKQNTMARDGLTTPDALGRYPAFHARIITKGSRTATLNARSAMLRAANPLPRYNHRASIARSMSVRCVDDGQVFRSQAECAKYYGVHQANLSKHLKGQPGFKTVSNRTFEYV